MRTIFTFSVAATMMIAGISSTAFAQHCKWDGGNVLVVSLKDKFGVPIIGAESQLKLKEIDNADPTRCSYAETLIEKDFAAADTFFRSLYKYRFDSWMLENCKDCNVQDAGNYAALINMAEENCLVKKEGINRPELRKYVVEYSGLTPTVQIAIDPSDFQSTCVGNDEWKPAKPLKF